MRRRSWGRLVAAFSPLPWTAFSAVVGVWATAEAVAALAHSRLHVQVSSNVVEPEALLLVGIGFLVAFVAMLGVTILALLDRRGRLWTVELVALLTVWAGGLWAVHRSSLGAAVFLLAFSGLFFATAVAAVMVVSRPSEVVPAEPGKGSSP